MDAFDAVVPFNEELNFALRKFANPAKENLLERSTQRPVDKEENDTTLETTRGIPPPPKPNDNILDFRQNLPIFGSRDPILGAISRRDVCIITSSTGSGKSSQVPQYLLEEFSVCGNPCLVACAQPRRLAAKNLAARVALERGEDLGGTVGYRFKHDNNSTAQTRLLYSTYGSVLAMLKNGVKFTHIVLDEAHERTSECDTLLLCFKEALRTKESGDAKLVIMSATLDLQVLEKYFPNSLTISVPGKTLHPVRAIFLEEINDVLELSKDEDRKKISSAARIHEIDYGLINQLVEHILNDAPSSNHCFLIFLPGWDTIATLKRMLKMRLCELCGDDFEIFKLHSFVKMEQQEKIFQSNRRVKLILATNVAESSITIPDVNYVIDLGREKVLVSNKGTLKLQLQWISEDKAKQRLGRAGRVQQGLYFRLNTEAQCSSQMSRTATPEISRIDLTALCLEAFKLKNASLSIREFLTKAPEPPLVEKVNWALNELRLLGCLTQNEELTTLGIHMMRLSLKPQSSKAVLVACFLKCIEPVITICCALEQKQAALQHHGQGINQGKKKQDKIAYSQNSLSDHFLIFNIFEVWKTGGANEKLWASQLSSSDLTTATLIQNQVQRQLHTLGLVNSDSNVNSSNWVAVKAALVAGYISNVGKSRDGALITKDNFIANLDNDCVFTMAPTVPPQIDLFIFNELRYAGEQLLASGCSPITPTMLFVMAGPANVQMIVGSSDLVKVANWLNFKVCKSSATGLLNLMQSFHSNFVKFLKNETSDWNELLKWTLCLLEMEEKAAKIDIPSLTNHSCTTPNEHSVYQPDQPGPKSDKQEVAKLPKRRKRKRCSKRSKVEEKIRDGEPDIPDLMEVMEPKIKRRLQTADRVNRALKELDNYQMQLKSHPFGPLELLKKVTEVDIVNVINWLETEGIPHSAEEVEKKLVLVREPANRILQQKQMQLQLLAPES